MERQTPGIAWVALGSRGLHNSSSSSGGGGGGSSRLGSPYFNTGFTHDTAHVRI